MSIATATNTVLDGLSNFVRKEPAALIGVAASAAVEVQQALVAGNAHDWKAVLPVLVALVVRKFVTSPATVEKILEDAVTAKSKVKAA